MVFFLLNIIIFGFLRLRCGKHSTSKIFFLNSKWKKNDIGIGIGLFISLSCDILKIHNWCFSHHSHYEPHIHYPIKSASDHSSTLTLSVCMFVACSMFVPYVVRQSPLQAAVTPGKLRAAEMQGLPCGWLDLCAWLDTLNSTSTSCFTVGVYCRCVVWHTGLPEKFTWTSLGKKKNPMWLLHINRARVTE